MEAIANFFKKVWAKFVEACDTLFRGCSMVGEI